MKYRIGYLILGVIVVLLALATMPEAQSGPVKMMVTKSYRINKTTIYEWRTGHNRLCTMVISDISSHKPVLSCS